MIEQEGLDGFTLPAEVQGEPAMIRPPCDLAG